MESMKAWPCFVSRVIFPRPFGSPTPILRHIVEVLEAPCQGKNTTVKGALDQVIKTTWIDLTQVAGLDRSRRVAGR